MKTAHIAMSLARTRARALQQFCTFCFHNLHKNLRIHLDYRLLPR